MEKKIQRNLLMMIFILTVAVFGASCNEDDDAKPENANCASLAEQLEAKYAELDGIGYNCEKMR